MVPISQTHKSTYFLYFHSPNILISRFITSQFPLRWFFRANLVIIFLLFPMITYPSTTLFLLKLIADLFFHFLRFQCIMNTPPPEMFWCNEKFTSGSGGQWWQGPLLSLETSFLVPSIPCSTWASALQAWCTAETTLHSRPRTLPLPRSWVRSPSSFPSWQPLQWRTSFSSFSKGESFLKSSVWKCLYPTFTLTDWLGRKF